MDLKQLLEKYRQGILSAEEREAFEQLLHSEESQAILHQLLDESLAGTTPVEAEETKKFLFQRIQDQLSLSARQKRQARLIPMGIKPWLRYAAVILMLLGAGTVYLFLHKKQGKEMAMVDQRKAMDIAPAHYGAILTLSDGRTIDLDTSSKGLIAHQNGSQVVLHDGSIAYNTAGKADKEVGYNTISTPRGRQFQIVLPDGTKVWLNAASSIRYPTVFAGNERRVAVTGEAYFEVATLRLTSGLKTPFKVQIDAATEVEVLGTHFNINAYKDEETIKTTLLEGRVKVGNHKEQSVILKPGEQASISKSITVQTADINQVMAWKNGLFNFNGYNIKAVMRELGRWYDLDLVYEGEPEPGEMMGEIQRNLTLSQVMTIMKKMHVNYKIEGRKLIIMK